MSWTESQVNYLIAFIVVMSVFACMITIFIYIKKEEKVNKEKISIPNLDVGYLDQGIKMNHKKENFESIILFLAYEIKMLKDRQGISE